MSGCLLKVLGKGRLELGLRAAAEDSLNARGSDGVIEVLVLPEPLTAGIVLARVLKGLVNGADVLGAAHRRDPLVRGLIDGRVVLSEAGRVPALANLWVNVSRAVEVSIDLLEDGNGDLVVVLLESVMEDNLQI